MILANFLYLTDVNDDSVIHALKLLYPKLENQLLLAKQVALIEPLKDLASHEEDTSFFAPEYLHILNNAETLMAEFKRQPAKLERLYGKIRCYLLNSVRPKNKTCLVITTDYKQQQI